MSSPKEAGKVLIALLISIGLAISAPVFSSEANSEDQASSSSSFAGLAEVTDEERNGLTNLFYELQILRQEVQ